MTPKKKRKTTTQQKKREEEEASEEPTPERPAKRPSGKNLSLMKQQAAEASGRTADDFGSPEATTSRSTAHKLAGFSSSLYGLEHGSTRVFGGKGRGKGGRRKPKKSKKKALQGWEDPQVVRALENRPPPGSIMKERNDEACRKKFGGAKMINSTKKKAPETALVSRNKTLRKAIKAGERCKDSQEAGGTTWSKRQIKMALGYKKISEDY